MRDVLDRAEIQFIESVLREALDARVRRVGRGTWIESYPSMYQRTFERLALEKALEALDAY